jgi:hypothetical protein
LLCCSRVREVCLLPRTAGPGLAGRCGRPSVPAIAHDARRARRYTFKLSSEDLSFINADNKRVVEPGLFDVQIGGRKQTFEWK